MAVGQVVQVQGLQSRSELNGRLAVVLELGDRLRCQAVSTGERIRLKPENVIDVDEVQGESRCRLRAADFPTLQAAVDAAAEKGRAVVEVARDYNEVVRITRPVSVIGGVRPGPAAATGVTPRWCVAGMEVDVINSGTDLVEIRNLQLGSAAAWLHGAGLRIFDGSPIVASCTIGGMCAIRVDSFKARSCPALVNNLLEARLGGIWWDGACWEALAEKGPGAPPISPAVMLEAGGMPKFVLETAAANHFSGDLRWICCIDSGVLAVLTAEHHVMPLEVSGPSEKDRRALAAQVKACPWFVHRPTLALMDRPELVQQRAAWATLAEEPENAVRLEVQTRKMFSEPEQIRHYREVGDLLPEDVGNVAFGSAHEPASLEDDDPPPLHITELEEPAEPKSPKDSESNRQEPTPPSVEYAGLQWQRMRELEGKLSEGYPQ